ncbi:MAG: hypothetical protein ACFFCO_04910 [Promethearchaeota archaeon]
MSEPKVVDVLRIGGVSVRLEPYDFIQLVEQERLTTFHGIKGTVSRWHIYVAVSRGVTFYVKVRDSLPKFKADVEAEKIYASYGL